MVIVVEQPPHSWLEIASWAAQIIIAITATAGAIFAGIQLLAVKKVSQASLLLELDARFDSQDMRESRILLDKIKGAILDDVNQNSPLLNDEAKVNNCKAKWRERLEHMRHSDQENYIKLIGWVGFFETVGIMIHKKYVSEADIFDLYKGPIVDIHSCFHQHITNRQKETGVPNGMLEHALRLGENAVKV